MPGVRPVDDPHPDAVTATDPPALGDLLTLPDGTTYRVLGATPGPDAGAYTLSGYEIHEGDHGPVICTAPYVWRIGCGATITRECES